MAESVLNAMRQNLYDRITIFAPRKSGKTEFVQRDITPLAISQDILVVYVDFWRDKQSPARAFGAAVMAAKERQESFFSRALKGSSLKAALKLAGGEVSIETKKQSKEIELTIAEAAFRELESTKKPVLLLLDEVQHLATSGFEDFTAALRSFMTARSDNKVKGIFTGSSQEGLSQLFKRTKAPFYRASESIPFPHLDMGFVKYELDVFKKVTGGKSLDPQKSMKIFAILRYGPGHFTGLLKRMAIEGVYDINEGLEKYKPKIYEQDSEDIGGLLKLKLLDKVLLTIIARDEVKAGLYTEESLDLIMNKNEGRKPQKASIQNALNRLRKKGYLYSPEHGIWKIEDPLIEKILIDVDIYESPVIP